MPRQSSGVRGHLHQSITPNETLIGAARLEREGKLEASVEVYREAIRLEPGSPVGYNSLGQIFATLNDLDTALVFFKAALNLAPGSPEIHNNLAALYLKKDCMELAATHFDRAARLSPRNPIYPNHLGQVLLARGNTVAAEACILHALALDPGCAEAYVNLGFLQSLRFQFAESETSYRRALALKPALAQAHVNFSQLLLRLGDFAEGWAEHEWRWRWKEFPSPKRNFREPQWRGEPVSKRTLFLHAEQGFGDTIQFLRYVPLVAERGATVVLEVHPELRQVAATLPGVTTLIVRGDAVPSFDLHCPLMSLPLAFGTTLETIPTATPYLAATRPAPPWVTPSGQLKVGVAWAGSPRNLIDKRRSLTLDALLPLLEVPGISFYSLQLGASASRLFAGSLPPTADFAETAAAVTALDLVISVDTAVAHLAGALGKPVWILLPALPDWRWLLHRDDSPWYPSARLFRQAEPGQWASVIGKVATALGGFARS